MSPFTLYRKDEKSIRKSSEFGGIFDHYEPGAEKWLFIVPHDDDVVIGSGLLLQKAFEENVNLTVLITTDGRQGYCRPDDRSEIATIRKEETARAVSMIGNIDIVWLEFPDCALSRHKGRVDAQEGDPCVIGGASGLQNAYTYYFRKMNPSRIFLAAGSDLHPDHKTVYEEALISVFHAGGDIWPELGKPLTARPFLYEFAVYCDFDGPPDYKIAASQEAFHVKLDMIRAYRSQKQIEDLVKNVEKGGPVEYLREVRFHLYDPRVYKGIF